MTHDPREALEPCPFCGGGNVILSHKWDYGFIRRYPYCNGCGARGPSFNGEEEARAWWNTRALTASTGEQEPPPTAGWDDNQLQLIIERALLDDEYFGNRAADEDQLEAQAHGSAALIVEALRREAPAPEGVAKIGPQFDISQSEPEMIWDSDDRPDAGGGVRASTLSWNEYEREGDIDEWDTETTFGTFYSVKRHAFCFMPSYDGAPIQNQGQQSPEAAKAICQADYERRIRSALSTPPAAAEKEADDWRDDPSADERWNAGLDFAMGQFCAALGVDPKSVRWDAATETLDGDVNAVIWNILRARFGEDWDPATAESSASVEARLREGSMSAQWTYDPEAEAYYFAPTTAAPGPYLKQRHVEAIIDIAADGTLAGVELIDNMPPPPANALSAVRDEAKKSDGGVEGHASVTSTAALNETSDLSASRAESAPRDVSVPAGIKPGPSDPTAERREIVARALRSLKEITPKGFANYHNLIDEALSGLAALDGGR